VTSLELDSLQASHVTPVLAAAGFKRPGRRYVLEALDASAIVVGFRTFEMGVAGGFLVDWAYVPVALRDFFSGDRGRAAPVQITWGVLRKPLFPVEEFRSSPRTSIWKYSHDGGLEPCGEALAGLLQKTMVPFWHGLLRDRDRVQHELDDFRTAPFNDGVMSSQPWRSLALCIDDGDAQELAALIEQALDGEPGSRAALWFRDRLSGRAFGP